MNPFLWLTSSASFTILFPPIIFTVSFLNFAFIVSWNVSFLSSIVSCSSYLAATRIRAALAAAAAAADAMSQESERKGETLQRRQKARLKSARLEVKALKASKHSGTLKADRAPWAGWMGFSEGWDSQWPE